MKDSTIKLSQYLQNIASALDDTIEDLCGERIPFTLIVFTDERASYISTTNREDSVREIKNLLSCWDQGMPDVPAHMVQ